MCGIAGYASLTNNVIQEKLLEMSKLLKHRGPDSDGVWINNDRNVGLAHTRLSILDLSNLGSQPMISNSGRYIISFNGEIYNHLVLRKELIKKKPLNTFKSFSDTETLLFCFEEYGIKETLMRVTGMFALAVYDTLKNEISLSRDRFGEKPLYYGIINNEFVFSSELKVIINSYKKYLNISKNNLLSFFRYSYIPKNKTIYNEIFKIEPGNIMNISFSQNTFKVISESYWDLDKVIYNANHNIYSGNLKQAVQTFDELLTDSIKSQMISDVPIGAFLSGGIDSSLVVSIMQSLSSEKINTFTIGFQEDYFNEAIFAEKVSKIIGTNHHELYISEKDVINIIPEIGYIFDEPFADSSQLPTLIVSKFAKKYVTVCLSGDGGDEIFAGYNRYVQANRISRLPNSFLKILLNPIGKISEKKLYMFYDLIKNFLPNSYKSSNPKIHLDKILSVINHSSEWDIYHNLIRTDKGISNQLVINNGTVLEINSIEDDFNHLIDDFNFVDRMIYSDIRNYLSDDILCKVDRTAMSVSLETRVPFLDHKLVDFAWSLPQKFKIYKGDTKYISKIALQKYLPINLIDRPKMGFGIPINRWLKRDLKSWAEAILFSERTKNLNYLNHDLINKLWNEHITDYKDNSSILWNILMYLQWNQNYN